MYRRCRVKGVKSHSMGVSTGEIINVLQISRVKGVIKAHLVVKAIKKCFFQLKETIFLIIAYIVNQLTA